MPRDACPHRPPCPGCPRYGRRGIADGARREIEALAESSGATLEALVEAPAAGHRHRARLMVRGRSASPKVGLFQQGSHRIVDVPSCRVHHPRINEAAAALKRALRESGTPPYAESGHGLVRALQAVVERASGTLQLVLVVNDDAAASTRAAFEALQREVGDALHSLWWNGNPGSTNVILGPHWQRVHGADAVRETIGGAQVFFPPGAFGQSHLDLADRIVARVHAEVDAGMRVVELYAGCGAVGLGLAAKGHDVAFNERSPDGLIGLERGVAALPAGAGETTLLRGDAADHAGALARADVAILDPPRKGLDPALVAQLASDPPPRVLYVSCGLPSLLRDAAALLQDGRLALRRVAPFALFPYTDHVETLAVFERT